MGLVRLKAGPVVTFSNQKRAFRLGRGSENSDSKVTQGGGGEEGVSLPRSAEEEMSVEDLPRKEVNVLKGHEGAVLAARFNGDGNYCLSCGKDRTIRLWNPHRGIHIKTYKSHGREVRDVHVTPYPLSLSLSQLHFFSYHICIFRMSFDFLLNLKCMHIQNSYTFRFVGFRNLNFELHEM